MKREVITYPKVKKIFPILFWRTCNFCNKEFVRETGYQIEDYTIANRRLCWSYCCNECANNIEDVKLRIKQKQVIFNNKKPPRPFIQKESK